MDEGDAYQELRPLLFSIAYRMVGSASEAEDLVQEAYLRFHRAVAGGAEVDSPKAYLSTVTTRQAIDHLRSARARREQYVGDWLPEPLVTGEAADPAVHAETADSLSLAFLVLLERLSPVQRAVFLLHEVFGYPYAEIAGLVGRSEDTCRQTAARARRHLEAAAPGSASRRQREGWPAGPTAVDGATPRAWSACWPPTSSGTAAAGAAAAPSEPAVAHLSAWPAGAAPPASATPRPRSTATPACSPWTRPAACWASSPSTSPTAGSRRSARSSTPTSSATSARSAT
jgi:RNA polymerase sigma factor (sigma-70 family)